MSDKFHAYGEGESHSGIVCAEQMTNRRVVANGALEMPIGIGTNAAIVVQPACGGLRRGAIEPVATALTYQHPLQQGRLNRAPR